MTVTSHVSLLSRIAAASDAATLPVRAPFTREVIHDLPLSTPDAVALAALGAREAQRVWAQTPVRERVRIMRAFHDLVLAKRDEAMDILQWETGKARRDAFEEVLDVCITTRHYSKASSGLLRPRRKRGALPVLTSVREIRKPVGLVGVIAPWNYPLTLAASDAVPALLAGNAVLVKPDPQTSLIAAWVAEQFLIAGLPDGLFTVITGDGPVIGPEVIAVVDHVMFTGSTATGRVVARQCAERLIGCSLELGGKNAMIVRADADISRAAEIAVRACFANTGQLCISMERMYIHEAIYDAFLAEFLPRVHALRIAPEVGWGYDVGVLISPAHLDRVSDHVDQAISAGAKALVGGRLRPDISPLAFEPTVLEGVTEAMTLCREETFGPVVSVYPVSGDEDAVRRANDTTYGLNASILTRDVRAAQRMAEQLKTGSVNINEGYAASWGSTSAAMGGVGDSGLGQRHGEDGLLTYTEVQTIATQRLMGFGAPGGVSDEQWGRVLSVAIGAMKRLGL